jgi:murein L,D-transpeptidase YcbB/YkuD
MPSNTPSLHAVALLLMMTSGAVHARNIDTDIVDRPTATAVVIDEGEVSDPRLRRLYAKAKWRALWSADTVSALKAALADRGRHGLDHLPFGSGDIRDAGSAGADVALSRTALDYAEALAVGRIDPASLYEVYTLPRPKTDVVAGLATALTAGTLTAWLDSLAPQDTEYRALSEAYLRFDRAATTTKPVEALSGGLIRVGDADERVPAIADQLAGSGYLAAHDAATVGGAGEAAALPGPASPARYTQAMADALKGLQTDYGIAADGVVGPATLKVLNLGPGDRARSLAVALELRRWLARTPPATRIDVNTAAARLRYYRDGVLTDARTVVVGEPGHGVADAWQAAQASGVPTFVPLPARIPVRLLYHNAFIGDDGAVAFRTDPYGWNDPIAERLSFAGSSAQRAVARAIDVGP